MVLPHSLLQKPDLHIPVDCVYGGFIVILRNITRKPLFLNVCNTFPMFINPDKCVACANCVAVCPMEAIYIDTTLNRAVINDDRCVECGNCYRGMSKEILNPPLVRLVRKIAKMLRFRFEPEPDICPTSAFEMNDLEMPRLIRRIFSDPTVEHASTGIKGRGTEEVKTNDVTGRIGPGEVGLTIEFGRPGVGVYFRDIQTMTLALAGTSAQFETDNPVTHLMTDKSNGKLRQDILEEKVMSAIVELKTSLAEVEPILYTISKVNKKIETVITVGISTRCDEEGEDTLLAPLLDKLGHTVIRAKTNMGLGRITNRIIV